MRELVYYIAVSADGFIAAEDGETSMFPVKPETLEILFDRYPETCPEHLREALGVTASEKRFDTVIMGYQTHKPALDAGLTSAYPRLRQIVVTHQELPQDRAVEAIYGDIAAQVAQLKREDGKDIWLCGGGNVAAQLIDQIDELQLKVNPVVLGTGIPLFAGLVLRAMDLIRSEVLPGGAVLLTYRRREVD